MKKKRKKGQINVNEFHGSCYMRFSRHQHFQSIGWCHFLHFFTLNSIRCDESSRKLHVFHLYIEEKCASIKIDSIIESTRLENVKSSKTKNQISYLLFLFCFGSDDIQKVLTAFTKILFPLFTVARGVLFQFGERAHLVRFHFLHFIRTISRDKSHHQIEFFSSTNKPKWNLLFFWE